MLTAIWDKTWVFWMELLSLLAIVLGVIIAYQSLYPTSPYDGDTWNKDKGGVWLIETSDGRYLNTAKKWQWSFWFKTKSARYISFQREIISEVKSTTNDGVPTRAKLRTTFYVPFNQEKVLNGEDQEAMASLKSKLEEQFVTMARENHYSLLESKTHNGCWGRCYNSLGNAKSDTIKQDLGRLNAEWKGYVGVTEFTPSF